MEHKVNEKAPARELVGPKKYFKIKISMEPDKTMKSYLC